MDAILEVKNLSKHYNSFSLNKVNLTIPKGSIVGLIGENGAGKTTTIKAIIGAIQKDGGEIKLFGRPFHTTNKEVMQQIAIVMEGSSFHEELSPRQMVKVLKGLYKKWNDATFNSYLRQFNVPATKKLKEFSKGMRMKLSIAIALSYDAKLLILDEPTSGLDPVVRNEILNIFQDFIIDEERAILLSSHITADLEKIADYITFIHNGEVILNDMKDDLIYNYGVVKCSEQQFNSLDLTHIIGYEKGQFAVQALVNNKQAVQHMYPELVIDAPTIDDIMLYYVRGDKK
ncbi:ABC transporter ATP-binding protein [Solibacillus daqui]|uniref:ABC transporter ATP-binding protein n=1 Tax=Solibacillus daqui TaxID=2912187 RepID=UPI0023653ABC|nr:ABC transporter ATP-binding protein [Solibacillus daqui]